MTESLKNQHGHQWARIALGALIAASVPFWAVGLKLGWDTIRLPHDIWDLAWARVWSGALLAQGLATGITGAAVALTTASARAQGLGVSVVLMGSSLISLAFVGGRYREKLVIGCDASLVPFLVPFVLLLCGVAVFAGAMRGARKSQTAPESSAATEEQPQPLSLP